MHSINEPFTSIKSTKREYSKHINKLCVGAFFLFSFIFCFSLAFHIQFGMSKCSCWAGSQIQAKKLLLLFPFFVFGYYVCIASNGYAVKSKHLQICPESKNNFSSRWTEYFYVRFHSVWSTKLHLASNANEIDCDIVIDTYAHIWAMCIFKYSSLSSKPCLPAESISNVLILLLFFFWFWKIFFILFYRLNTYHDSWCIAFG